MERRYYQLDAALNWRPTSMILCDLRKTNVITRVLQDLENLANLKKLGTNESRFQIKRRCL